MVNRSAEQQLRSKLDQLKQLVREQQRRIDALESGCKPDPHPAIVVAPAAAPVVPSAAPAATSAAITQDSSSAQPSTNSAPSPQTVSQAQTVQAGSSDERIRNLERQIQGLGPISFSSNVRLRAEPFFGGPANESMDRVRGRVRVRFNAFANLGSQFRAGITLASGDINNPIGTNQDRLLQRQARCPRPGFGRVRSRWLQESHACRRKVPLSLVQHRTDLG
jgi:Putative porin